VDVWLTILGGVIAGLVGLGLWWVQHRVERADARRDLERGALVELAGLLLPLLIEIERPLESRGYWVDNLREMRRLGTWIRDPAENAQKGPDWERIADAAQQVERQWWGDLQLRITDPQMRKLREDFYEQSVAVALRTPETRLAVTQLSVVVEAALERITALVGTDLAIVQDRPPRPAAPEVRNQLRAPPQAR
jgi:hypothetical protein